MMNTTRMIGYLVAFFLLVGRWTPGRIVDNDSYVTIVMEPRLWATVAIVILSAAYLSMKKPITCPRAINDRLLVFLILLFLSYLMMAALWAPDSVLSVEKCYELGLVAVVVACVALHLRTPAAEELRLGFWTGLVAMAFAMAILSLGSVGHERTSVLGGGPIVFGRNMGLMLLGALYLQPRHRTWSVFLWIVIGAIGSLLIVMSGSRGALFAICVAGTAHLLLDKLSFRRKVILVLLFCGIFCYILTSTRMGHDVQEMFSHRILELTVEQQYTSGREDLYHDAYDLAKEHPYFGYGLSGFRYAWGTYPHNIFMEVLGETGTLGGSLFFAMLVAAALSIKRLWRWRQLNGATTAAVVHTFTSSQFSGDLFDSRGIFILLVLAIIPDVLEVRLAPVRRISQLKPYSSRRALQVGI